MIPTCHFSVVFHFFNKVSKSKRGIIQILIDEALPPKTFQSLVEKSLTNLPADARLRLAATIARKLYDAEKTLIATFLGAALLSPEIKRMEQEWKQRRYQRLQHSVDTLTKEQALCIPPEKAHDILWSFTGRDLYRLLVLDRKWTSDAYETWLGDTLIQLLLDTRTQTE